MFETLASAGVFFFVAAARGSNPVRGAELSKRLGVCQRSAQGAKGAAAGGFWLRQNLDPPNLHHMNV